MIVAHTHLSMLSELSTVCSIRLLRKLSRAFRSATVLISLSTADGCCTVTSSMIVFSGLVVVIVVSFDPDVVVIVVVVLVSLTLY